MRNPWSRHETARALARIIRTPKCSIVPIIVGDFDRSALPPELGPVEYLDANVGLFDEWIWLLKQSLDTREME
jgi:hypothetical protein